MTVNGLLTATYLLLFVLMLAGGIFIAVNSKKLVGQYKAMTTWSTSTLNELGNMRKSAAYIQVATLRHATAEDSLTKQHEELIITREYALNGERLNRMDTLLTDPEGRLLLEAVSTKRLLNAKGRDRVLALSYRDGPAAIKLHNRDQYASFEDFQNSVTVLVYHVNSTLEHEREMLNKTAKQTVGRILALLGTMAFVLLLLGLMVHRSNRKTAYLLQTNIRYRKALERSMNVMVTDSKGQITDVSDSLLKITSYTREELIGQNPRIFNSGHHPKEFFKELWNTVLDGEIWQGEVCNRAKDGSLHWMQTSVVPFTDMNGRPEQFVVLRQDTTARRMAEDDLALQRQWLDTMLNSIGDALIATDTDGNIVRINPVAEELTGWPRAEAMGRPLQEIFHIINQQTRQPATNPVQEALRTGRIVGLANHTALISRNGREYVISDSGSPIRDKEGRMVGVIMVFKDDTETHLAQMAIEESEFRYRSFVEESSELIFSIGLKEELTFANKTWLNTLGYAEDDLTDCSVWDFIAEESVEDCRLRLSRIFNGEAVGGVKAVFVAKDGRRVPVEGSATPRFHDGKVIGSLAFLSDVTARKEAEQVLVGERNLSTSIINSLPGLFYLIDKHGKLLRWNSNLEQFAGRVPTSESMTIGDLVADETDLPRMNTVFYNVLKGQSQEAECLLRRADGAKMPYLLKGIPFDVEGERHVVGLGIDISARVQAKEALRQSEVFNRGVLASLSAHIAVIDNEGIILSVNRAWMDFAQENGPVPMERVGIGSNYFHTCRMAAQGGDTLASEALQGMMDVLEGRNQIFTFEYPCHAPDTERWFLMRALRFDSRDDRMVVSHTDITLRKQAEVTLNEINEQLEKTVAERTESLLLLNRDMTDSIVYAKRIQDAVLPSYRGLAAAMPNTFLYSSPHSIVSGDFLWWHRLPEGMLVAAVDCTGHGVPGALMSVIATNLLNRVVKEHGLSTPSEVLYQLNSELVQMMQSFHGGRSEVRDGMDIALCYIDVQKGKMIFAGAYRPLWVAAPSGEVAEYRGSTFSIGGGTSDYEKQYTDIDISFVPGSMIYLTSDGMQSQFGGPSDRKYGKRAMREFFSHIAHLPTQEQAEAVRQELEQWMNGNEQTDDVLVVGIRL